MDTIRAIGNALDTGFGKSGHQDPDCAMPASMLSAAGGPWRRHDQIVNHIVVRSFSRYIAGGNGCTTFSFIVEGGVFYRCVAEGDLDRPKVYDWTFRIAVSKSLRQPSILGEPGPDGPDVWHVRADGSNLDQCLQK